MNLIDAQTPVGHLVAERPELTRVLERLGIDYCCGGRKPLAQACQEKSLEVAEVVARLEDALAGSGSSCEQRWLEKSLTELTRHIEAEHHGYLRRELPRVQALADKVARVHGEGRPDLVTLSRVVQEFSWELDSHMQKEEQILFPMIRQLEGGGAGPAMGCGSVAGPIRQMELEHDGAGEALAEMRRLTGDFQPPMEACGTWRALYHALAELEADMHRHVHEENNILFPRALKL